MNDLVIEKIDDKNYRLAKKDGSKLKDDVRIYKDDTMWHTRINNFVEPAPDFKEACRYILYLYDNADLTDFRLHMDEYKSMRIIDLLNLIADRKNVPSKIWYPMNMSPWDVFVWDEEEMEYWELCEMGDRNHARGGLQVPNHHLNDTIYVIEE